MKSASPKEGSALTLRSRLPHRRWHRSRGKRAVAEVVATIILLALTVVLFSAIFAFVTSFPSPPAQSNNQFQASLGYTVATNGTTYITSVSILHLAGPAVPSTGLIYLKSASHPSAAQFQYPYSLSNGGLASGAEWNLGQTWTHSFPTGVASLPDNLTVYVVSSSAVLFSVILPGQSFVYPPTFVAISVSPANPTIGSSFNISATITGSVTKGSVYANLAAVPGLTSKVEQLKYAAATGQYYLNVTSSLGYTTAAGTYYAFLNATGSNGQSSTTALAITVATGTPVVTTPTLSLSPVSGKVGASLTATGAGYSGSTSVALTLNGATVTLTACSSGTISSTGTSVTTTSAGGFACTFAIPSGLTTGGTYTVFATGLSSGQTATALLSVISPAVSSPGANFDLTEGTSEAVTGSGFTPGGTVTISIEYKKSTGAAGNESYATCNSGSLTVTSTGTFTCTITLPTPVTNDSAATVWVEDVVSGNFVSVAGELKT